jgi:hypothetical protein
MEIHQYCVGCGVLRERTLPLLWTEGVGGGEMQRDKRRRDEGRGGGKMKKTEALCRNRENSEPSVFSFLLKQCPL